MGDGIGLIGFGEAGESFARAADWRTRATVWDIAPARRAVAGAAGLRVAGDAAGALAGMPLVLSLVTADAAPVVARVHAESLASGALWCDMNSVAPATKHAAAEAVHAAGARYVDVAVMAPVNPLRLAVPLLLAGPHAEAGREALAAAGFTDLRVVGDEIGRASTIKMLRSVMYKGVEALTAECLIACERAGVTAEVLASFGNDWSSGADYRFDRMLLHGTRRAEELREVCKTLAGLGLPARMSSGTVAWQAELGAIGAAGGTPSGAGALASGAGVPDGLSAKLALIAAAGETPQ